MNKQITEFIFFFTVKPYIVGEGLQSMIIKKGHVITFDIKYGGEPEPEVKWLKGEEVLQLYKIFGSLNFPSSAVNKLRAIQMFMNIIFISVDTSCSVH